LGVGYLIFVRLVFGDLPIADIVYHADYSYYATYY